MRIGSLFSGAGGLDMAVEQAFGGRTVWQSELDSSASKVLAHRFPGVPNLGDITAVDWTAVEPVDVLCGGFPCQDVSAAGKRAGIAAGTRSGLWLEFANIIDHLRPRFVVIENVRGLLSGYAHRSVESAELVMGDRSGRPVLRAAGAVLGDLADLGYDAQWSTVAASNVGAPHRRERVFILAVDANAAGERGTDIAGRGAAQGQFVVAVSGAGNRDRSGEATARGELVGRATSELATVGCTCWQLGPRAHNGHCCWGSEDAQDLDPGEYTAPCGHRCLGDGYLRTDNRCPTCSYASHLGLSSWYCPDPNVCGNDVVLLPTPAASRSGNNQSASPGAAIRPSLDSITELLPTPSVADSQGGHLTRSGARSDELLLPGVARAYGNGELLSTTQARDFKGVPADGFNTANLCRNVTSYGTSQWGKYEPAIRRWEQLARPAPSPTEPNTRGNPRLAAPFPEWMMGWPAGWVTQVPGISRNDQLRIIGNGVCPQQAIAALYWLLRIAEVAA